MLDAPRQGRRGLYAAPGSTEHSRRGHANADQAADGSLQEGSGIVAKAFTALHEEFIEDVPATVATALASSPVTPKVQAARPAGVSVKGGADGDARLPVRESIKQAALAQPSPTQVAKEGVAKLRKDERRQQIIERRRQAEADELAALDAEGATVFSGDDSHR